MFAFLNTKQIKLLFENKSHVFSLYISSVNIPQKMGRLCLFLLSIENGPSLKVGRDWCLLKMGRVRKWAEIEIGPRCLEIIFTTTFKSNKHFTYAFFFKNTYYTFEIHVYYLIAITLCVELWLLCVFIFDCNRM